MTNEFCPSEFSEGAATLDRSSPLPLWAQLEAGSDAASGSATSSTASRPTAS